MIKRLIFDIDGTLIIGASFDKAIENSLSKYNIFSEENKQKFIYAISTYENNYNEYDSKQYLQYFSSVLSINIDSNFLETFFENLGKYAIPEYNPKLIETIENLSKKYELVLLSNYFEKSQRGRLKNMGIDTYFSEYYGEKVCKPNKKAYIDALGTHKPEECVMIGDNVELDIAGAKKCGINTIWVNSKKNNKTSVRSVTVNDICEINEKLIESFEKDTER